MKREELPIRKPGHREASAALTAALGTAKFPASKNTIADEIGEWKIPLGRGETVTLREILESIPETEFRSSAEAANRIDSHWDKVAALRSKRK